MKAASPVLTQTNDYPTSDGKPMAETDWHRELMLLLIEILKNHFGRVSSTYVSGNLLVFYQPGNRRRHVSPDVFVVRGVGSHNRPNYLIWEEGKGPEVVIELTSSSTRREDMRTKFQLYQDTLRVKEYFLFDPRGDYLTPPMQGYRLRKGIYHKIRPVGGRLRSRVLGLGLERHGQDLRLFDPATGAWLPTPAELISLSEQARLRAAEEAMQTFQQMQQEHDRYVQQMREEYDRYVQQVNQRVDEQVAETNRLRQELEELRRQFPAQE